MTGVTPEDTPASAGHAMGQAAPEFVQHNLPREVRTMSKLPTIRSWKRLINAKHEVAVIYHPSYGSGWSTSFQNDRYVEQFMLFDEELAQAVIAGDSEAMHERVHAEYGRDLADEICMYASDRLRVEWIPVNSVITLRVCDGYETIVVHDLPEGYSIT